MVDRSPSEGTAGRRIASGVDRPGQLAVVGSCVTAADETERALGHQRRELLAAQPVAGAAVLQQRVELGRRVAVVEAHPHGAQPGQGEDGLVVERSVGKQRGHPVTLAHAHVGQSGGQALSPISDLGPGELQALRRVDVRRMIAAPPRRAAQQVPQRAHRPLKRGRRFSANAARPSR